MNSLQAFAMGEANRGKEQMIFDWEKAARIIREKGVQDAYAGLRGDWENTGGAILRDGQPVRVGYLYLASTWAVPELELESETIPCYRMQSQTPGWTAKTRWGGDSLMILRGEIA